MRSLVVQIGQKATVFHILIWLLVVSVEAGQTDCPLHEGVPHRKEGHLSYCLLKVTPVSLSKTLVVTLLLEEYSVVW
jgi:hypothetical protein